MRIIIRTKMKKKKGIKFNLINNRINLSSRLTKMELGVIRLITMPHKINLGSIRRIRI